MSTLKIKCPHCGKPIEPAAMQDPSFLKKEKAKWEKERLEKDKALEAARKSELKQEREKIHERYKLNQKNAELSVKEKTAKIMEIEKEILEIRAQNRKLKEDAQITVLEVQRQVEKKAEEMQGQYLEKLNDNTREWNARVHKLTIENEALRNENSNVEKKLEDIKNRPSLLPAISGASAEINFLNELKAAYPNDEITPVPKGKSGADFIHKVFGSPNRCAGTMIEEVKFTNSFKPQWIPKLKDDQKAISAEVALLITQTMPPGKNIVEIIDGVYVIDMLAYPGIVDLVRSGLIQVSMAQGRAENKNSLKELVWEYLGSATFQQRIQTVVECYHGLKANLDKERNSLNRIWSAREKEIKRIGIAVASMIGDLQGLSPDSFPLLQPHFALEAPLLSEKPEPTN